jgi:type VI secretion system secreted protein Hcp
MPIYMGIFDKPNVLSPRFKGSVKAKGFEGWIELESAQISTVRAPQSPGSASRGAPAAREIAATKLTDATSAALGAAAKEGEEKLTILAFVKSDGTVTMEIVLQDAIISSHSQSSGGEHPMESFSLNFTKITFDAAATSPDVTHTATYELSQQPDWDVAP